MVMAWLKLPTSTAEVSTMPTAPIVPWGALLVTLLSDIHVVDDVPELPMRVSMLNRTWLAAEPTTVTDTPPVDGVFVVIWLLAALMS
jgi:hypothetical protein